MVVFSLPSRLLQRRTFSSSQGRVIALSAILIACFLATSLVLYISTQPSHEPVLHRHPHHHPHGHHRQHFPDLDQEREFERRARNSYTFSQHPGEELGALVLFLSKSNGKNVLPANIDTHAYLDPELVFAGVVDAKRPGVEMMVEHLVQETWARYPVVLFIEVCLVERVDGELTRIAFTVQFSVFARGQGDV